MRITESLFQKNCCLGLLIFILALSSWAEAKPLPAKNKSAFPVKYTSEVDQIISLHTITLAPVYDNVKSVYAEPIQKLLLDLLQNDKVWGYSKFPDSEKKVFVETFETNPKEVLNILTQTSSQGLLTAIITKGPNGLSAKLKLFTLDQGLLLAEESFQDLNAFELPRLREEFITLYLNIKNKMPYRGFILSRRGLEVTLNAGSKNGVTLGQQLTLAQILKVNRHPKLKFMVGTEKEIIGRVQVTKVEPYLSFGQIIFEKETGVVATGAKLLPTDSVSYPRPLLNSAGEFIDDKQVTPSPTKSSSELDSSRGDVGSSKNKPQFGKAILQGGLGQFSESARYNSGASIDNSQSVAPTLLLGGEFWISTNWFVQFNLKQSLFKTDNASSSTPTSLNNAFANYTGSIGYYFLLLDNFWGPKFSAQLGYSSYKTDVTDSTPTTFTSTNSGGALLKLAGSFPLEPELPIEVGAFFDVLVNPTFSESPVSFGSASARINSFGLSASYHATHSLRYRFDLNFDQIQADFSNAGLKRSSTLKMTTQLIGIEYLY